MIEKKYVTVQDKKTLEQLFNHIQKYDILAYDTETESLNPRTGKIVGWSISGKEGEGFYLPTYIWDYSKEELVLQEIGGQSAVVLSKKLIEMLTQKKLVMHNASFDCQYTENFFGVDLLPSLWVDTMMLVHTVQEEGAGMGVFGLKPIAVSIQKELGLDVEKEANQEQLELKASIKENGGAITKENFEIYKADLSVLSKYASADTDLTLRICNYFLPRLEQEGLWKFFFDEEVMPVYKEVTVPMEKRGVALDMELIQRTNTAIEEELKENKKIVMDSLLKTEGARKWVIDMAFLKYPPKKSGRWAQELCKIHDIPLPKTSSGQYSLGKKNIEGLAGECPENIRDFLLTGDTSLIPDLQQAQISIKLWKEENEGDYINIQSKKHLGEIVFDYMGEQPLSKTTTGRSQFDMDTIEYLSDKYEWAENLRIYNKLLKIKSTYIDRFLKSEENGKHYPYFKQHGTVSGRYGSDMQQLPKPLEPDQDVELLVYYTNLVRAFFIAGQGRKFIDDDYMSLEPRIFASVTGDEGLKEIYEKGWDFYSTVAIKTEKLNEDKATYPNGVSPDPKDSNYLKKLNPVKRNLAKAYSLGLAYGMSAYALAMTLNISKEEGKKLHTGYLKGFPKLEKWIETSRAFTKEHGYIRNKVGRIRHLPQVKEIYEKFGDALIDDQAAKVFGTDKAWTFRRGLKDTVGEAQATKLYRDYRNGLNNCLNFQIQSMAASIVNRAALAINRKAKELGIDAQVILQIHDQLVIDVAEEQAEMFAPYVQEIMENTTKLEGVPLIAEPEIANNLKEGH